MKALLINTENLCKYEAYIPEHSVENIGRKYYRAFAVCLEDEKPVGVCIYKILYLEEVKISTQAFLETVFIDPGYRGKGYGRFLMEELKQRLDKEGVTRTIFELPKKENDNIIGFFQKFGFDVEEAESDVIHVTMEDIIKSPAVRKNKNRYCIGEIELIPMRKVRSCIMNCIFSGRKDMEADLPNLPISWFHPELSAYTMKDDKVTALFLIHQKNTKVYEPVLLFALEPDARKDLLNMIRFTANKSLDICSPDMDVVINRRNSAIKNLTQGFFPGIDGDVVYKGQRKE